MAKLPPAALPNKDIKDIMYDGWFNFPVRVYPHHTDYAGVVWHGTYVSWMEAARIECLRSAGVDFDQLVASGMDLPVMNLSIRYHHAIKMGEDAIVRSRITMPNKLRINFEHEVITKTQLCVTATVTIVAVDMQKQKILRSLPPMLEGAIAKLLSAGKEEP
ncbi:4-hydroxybenzoyl-CoA thioesterase [Thalassoporum mexicanum PCC 7367]|uniref:acyl-CoA thioesterase n=1 Tax=Thalassoporum mexicanum TaxID=3457544 RepID=UPI00029FCE59|nr:thioesterase family protein [Pseudanabaena sp. PCC 7367]AFY68362.1 4-hydroxybenzoyl-CoA thioesterase [Pseudanabaena sp. PCC 7367]